MKTLLAVASGLFIATAAVMLNQPTQAQDLPTPPESCVYLREVSTGKTAIRKVIATLNSNENVDFAVPTGTSFTSYIAKLIPENNTRYRARVNLKYNDGSSSTVVDRRFDAKRFYLYNQPFRSPTDRQPFQINTQVTGDRNTAYQVFVLACQ